MEYPSNYQIFGNQYYEKAEQRKQPPKLQHHQTESTKVCQQVWFHTGPQPKSTNQKRPQNISILCEHINTTNTHAHTPCLMMGEVSFEISPKNTMIQDMINSENSMNTTESTKTNIFNNLFDGTLEKLLHQSQCAKLKSCHLTT